MFQQAVVISREHLPASAVQAGVQKKRGPKAAPCLVVRMTGSPSRAGLNASAGGSEVRQDLIQITECDVPITVVIAVRTRGTDWPKPDSTRLRSLNPTRVAVRVARQAGVTGRSSISKMLAASTEKVSTPPKARPTIQRARAYITADRRSAGSTGDIVRPADAVAGGVLAVEFDRPLPHLGPIGGAGSPGARPPCWKTGTPSCSTSTKRL